jgi:NADH-quinone oxidoreductase subunit G
MVKQGGQWQAVDWNTALGYVADGLKRIKAEHGVVGIGAVGSAHRTVEELHLLAKLVRGLGSESIDTRTRHADFGNAAAPARPLAGHVDCVAVGLRARLRHRLFLRKDHPLFSLRMRQAVRKRGAQLSLNAVQDDWAMPVAIQPHRSARCLGAIAGPSLLHGHRQGRGRPRTGRSTPRPKPSPQACCRANARPCCWAMPRPAPAGRQLLALATWIARHAGATVGYLGEPPTAWARSWSRRAARVPVA